MSGATANTNDTTYYISITGLVLRSAWHAPKFYYHAIPSKIQAASAAGNLYTAVSPGPMHGYLMTMTIWENKKAMLAYMRQGAHLQAMRVFNDVASSGKIYGYETSSREPIPWEEAFQILMEKAPARHYGGGGGKSTSIKEASKSRHLLPSLLLATIVLLFAALFKMQDRIVIDDNSSSEASI
jgi:hypothetical protein